VRPPTSRVYATVPSLSLKPPRSISRNRIDSDEQSDQRARPPSPPLPPYCPRRIFVRSVRRTEDGRVSKTRRRLPLRILNRHVKRSRFERRLRARIDFTFFGEYSDRFLHTGRSEDRGFRIARNYCSEPTRIFVKRTRRFNRKRCTEEASSAK